MLKIYKTNSNSPLSKNSYPMPSTLFFHFVLNREKLIRLIISNVSSYSPSKEDNILLTSLKQI